MQAIIMAGGLGERLRPLTKIIPKPLLPIGERSVLEITLRSMGECGVNEIFVALNYQSELFRAFLGDGAKWNLSIHCSQEETPLGTAGPIRLFADRISDHFVIMNGDILTSLDYRDLMKAHREGGAALTVVTKQITLPLRYGVVESDDLRISAIREKPNVHAEVVAGIYACSPEAVRFIPDGGYYTMIDLINDLLAAGEKVNRFPLHDTWLDIGQLEDYERAQELYAQGAFRNPEKP